MKLRSCMHIGPFCLQDIIVFQGTTLLPWPLGIMVAVPTGFYCGFKGNECQSSHFLEKCHLLLRRRRELLLSKAPFFMSDVQTHWVLFFKNINVGIFLFHFLPQSGYCTHIKRKAIYHMTWFSNHLSKVPWVGSLAQFSTSVSPWGIKSRLGQVVVLLLLPKSTTHKNMDDQ